MMSMIIWDWLLARLLGRPVFGAEYDGQGALAEGLSMWGSCVTLNQLFYMSLWHIQ